MSKPSGDRKPGRILMQVLWPAFLVSIVAEGVLFSMVDPHELHVVASYLGDSREAAYTVAFLLFWALFTLSSGLTYILGHGDGKTPDSLPKPGGRERQDEALIGH